MKITNSPSSFGSGVKRFYLGAILETECPVCQKLCKIDFEQDYLSYPDFNSPEQVSLVCENEHEFSVSVILKLTMEPAP